MESIPIATFLVGLSIGAFIGLIVGCLITEPIKKSDLSKPHDDYD